MNLIAKVNGIDFEIYRGTIQYKLDAIDEFDVSILARNADYKNMQYEDIEIYSDGELMISGFIEKRPFLEKISESPILAKLSCVGNIGRLACTRARAQSHYQDLPVITILANLLSTANETWAIQLVNMVDPAIETTLDLRNKETLFGQILAAVKATPDVHLRYGGMAGSSHVLQIGNFADISFYAEQNHNLIDIALDPSSQNVVRIAETYGDLSANLKVNLGDALGDPRTAVYPDFVDFPITQDPVTLAWICTNTTISNGCEIRKSENIHKTENDEIPTGIEVNEAGYALYLKTVRFLKSSVPYDSYKASVLTPTPPNIGDMAYLFCRIGEPVFDAISGILIDEINTIEVSESFRMTSISTKFEKFQKDLIWDLQLTSNLEAEEFDSEVELYSKLENYSAFDDRLAGVAVEPPTEVVLSFTEGVDAPDCTFGGVPASGKLFSFPAPAVPPGATSVVIWYIANPSGANVQVDTPPPQVLGANYDLCVRPTSGLAWGTGTQTIEISAFFQYVF